MRWAIVGAGAQGRVTLDVLRAAGGDDEIVFVEDRETLLGRRVCGVPVAGREWLRQGAGREDTLAIVAIGHNEVRLRVAAELAAMNVRFGNAVHPSAVTMGSATLDVGITLCPGAVVGTGAKIGPHVLINTSAIVEHDCVLAEGASLSPGVGMAGRVRVERAAFVGTGALLNPRITVGRGAIVGTGAVVTRDVRPGTLVYGVPAREIRPVDPERDWQRLL